VFIFSALSDELELEGVEVEVELGELVELEDEFEAEEGAFEAEFEAEVEVFEAEEEVGAKCEILFMGSPYNIGPEWVL